MSNELSTEISGSVMVLRFTRPEIRNPLSVTVLEQLELILRETASNSDIEKLIFTGSGDSFASGADLREIAGVTPDQAPAFARYGQSVMRQIVKMPQKTFAAVNGWCFGGALDLALACDSRVATPNAKFAHPGVGLGIITGWGGTQRLPRLVGQTNALEMFFTATPIDASRALAIGLIDEIAEDAVAAILEES